MKRFRSIALLATAAALVALPATASAAPSVNDVRAAAKQARAALGDATDAAGAGNASQLRAAITELGENVRRAERRARRIKRDADSRRDRVRAARALTAVAGSYDSLVGQFAGILDQVSPNAQYLIAQAISLGANAQQQVLTMLAKLAERLPEPAAQAVIDAIERFEADGDLEALVAALASDEVTDAVKSVLSAQLDEMFAHVQGMIDRLAEFDPELAAMVGGVLDSVRGILDQVDVMLGDLFDGLLGGGIPLFPGFDDLPGFANLFSDLPGFTH